MEDSEMTKKFVGQFDSDFPGVWVQKISPSWPYGASKSAFPDFHGNRFEFQNSDPSTVISEPDRLSVPDFVKIGQEMKK